MRINAVFEGGGVKGIGLVGAIKAAEEAGMTFSKVAGTSSGALIAALLAAGYTAVELEQLIRDAPYKAFLNQRPITFVPFIDYSLRMIFKFGLHSGAALENWVSGLLAAKGIHTFKDLPENRLRIITSNISSGKMMVIPEDLANYGLSKETMKVATAVRMSCSIPLFFQPTKLRLSRKKADYIVDGALLSNFPLWLFDEEGKEVYQRTPTIGFQFVGRYRLGHPVDGLFSFIKATVATMIDAHDERYISTQNIFRTIKVPTLNISATDFHLDDKKSQMLFASGFQAGELFFKSFTREQYYAHMRHH
jgi:NTE family protein